MSQTLRVLEITLRADIGGGPEHLYQLLHEAGSEVQAVVACPDEPPYHDRYVALPNVISMSVLPHRTLSIGALRKLRRVCLEQKIAVIHSHGKGAGIYARALSVLTGRPCVHTFHGVHVGDYSPIARRAYFLIERLLGLATRAVICVSAGEQAQVEAAALVPRRKLHLIENGVVIPAEVADAAPGERLGIVAVSRYDHQKNPELLLEITETLRAQIGTRFHLTVLGQGDRLEAMRAAVAARGLADLVDLAGPHSAPREIYRQSDVFLSTSRWEGMPLALLEAMSEGLPIVASDVVGNRDVVEAGQSGLLYPSEDAGAAAVALSSLLAEPELAARLGLRGRDRVTERYSVARMAGKTLALYRQTLAG